MVTPNEQRIDELIQQAQDPVQRAELMVLQRLDASFHAVATAFDAHTKQFRELSAKFDTHVNDESILLASIKAALTTGRVIWGGVAVVVIGVGGFTANMLKQIGQDHLAQSEGQTFVITELVRRVAGLEAREVTHTLTQHPGNNGASYDVAPGNDKPVYARPTKK